MPINASQAVSAPRATIVFDYPEAFIHRTLGRHLASSVLLPWCRIPPTASSPARMPAIHTARLSNVGLGVERQCKAPWQDASRFRRFLLLELVAVDVVSGRLSRNTTRTGSERRRHRPLNFCLYLVRSSSGYIVTTASCSKERLRVSLLSGFLRPKSRPLDVDWPSDSKPPTAVRPRGNAELTRSPPARSPNLASEQ